MKNIKSILLTGALILAVPIAAARAESITIIPEPNRMEVGSGHYTFTDFGVYYDTKDPRLSEIVEILNEKIEPATGKQFKSVRQSGAELKLVIKNGSEPESYNFVSDARGVTIEASDPAGIFYGVQTLLQLLPAEIKSQTLAESAVWQIPHVSISDQPRFGWRGLMLDVSRHWFSKEEVMAYIDQLAEYKMNRFHWHLTDDQGWRVQIDALPRLTEVGAWRAFRVGDWWHRDPQQPGEAATYGGFYTKEDIAEVLEYSRRRYVTVIPEIDVPGHSLAALVAYPELSCFQAPEYVNVGNKFYGIDENSLCVGKPVVMEFMQKVLDEVVEMFPSEYIHIGGDECWKGFWAKCPDCQALKAREGLKDENELQSWFIRQMEKMLQEKGRKIIGWDEIHEGGLAPDATVMSWRGMQGGIDAARQGHHVIMTPNQHAYIDLYQGEPSVEPDTYSMLRLTDSYHFEPVPEGIDPEMILGGQGNLWAESVPRFRHAEYMTWPRGWALAEVFWTDPARKEWDGFIEKVEEHFRRADQADVNYARSMYNAIVSAEIDPEGTVLVTLSSEIPLTIYYTWDNTFPDRHGIHYEYPFKIPKDASRLTVTTYRDGKQIGAMIKVPVEEIRKRAVKTERVIGNI